MKKFAAGLFLATGTLALAACGAGGDDTSSGTSEGGEGGGEPKELVVGASNVPHALILEEAKPLLEEKGIELEIEPYQDYVLPNEDLESEEIDANYFQHIPYLETQMADHGYDFVNAGGIHIEPIGIYSNKHDSLEDLPDGATILMSNSVADHGRILSMLESQGLIKLDEGVDKTAAEVKDIVENPKNLEFDADYEASFLPQLYNQDEGDALLINSNYAIEAGLVPTEDSILIEDKDSPWVNVVAARADDKDDEAIKKFLDVYQSDEIKKFIEDTYKGSVIPGW